MLCFSSQYFFLLSIHIWGLLFMTLGVLIMLGVQYDLFGDWITIVIVVALHQGLALLARVFGALADQASLWELPTLAGTTSDEIAATLAVGEGSAVDLEQERME